MRFFWVAKVEQCLSFISSLDIFLELKEQRLLLDILWRGVTDYLSLKGDPKFFLEIEVGLASSVSRASESSLHSVVLTRWNFSSSRL